MNHNERPEFDRQMSVLCAAFDVPPGNRPDAYWTAFERLSLVEFARMVAAALADESSEKGRIPTVSQLWKIRRGLRTRTEHRPDGQSQADLVAEAVRRFRLTSWQLARPWSWIARNPQSSDAEILGVIIPQDPADPVKYPSRRVMFSELPV